MSETDTQATGAVAPEAVAEDTATIQTSEASEQSQVTPDATQGTDGGEGTSQAEVNAEDTVQEDKLYAGKYKSVDDLEKSYKELESKYGREASERAELTKILNEAFMSPASTTQSADTDYEDAGESSTVTTSSMADRKVAILEFILTHKDANASEMGDILKNDPFVNKINGEDAKLEYAYLRAQSMSRDKAIAEAQKQGQTQAQVKTAEKQVARVETVQKTEPADESAELFSRATGNFSQEERDRARRELIRKNLVNL
jgi:hypothetical protein